jgi:hypothetical protein
LAGVKEMPNLRLQWKYLKIRFTAAQCNVVAAWRN